MVGRVARVACGVAAIMLATAWATTPVAADEAAEAAEAEFEERARKAEILAGTRWRRAMLELDEWLAVQPVYTAEQVRHIKAGLAGRVAAMSSYELDYLLDTLEFKLRILDSPDAVEAREWLGRYLSVMADRKRAETLADLPDVVEMTSGELIAGLQRLEKKRSEVERRAADMLRGRREVAAFRAHVRRDEVSQRTRISRIRRGDVSFSPYRAPSAGAAPFSDAYDSPTVVGVGPWGTFVATAVGGL